MPLHIKLIIEYEDKRYKAIILVPVFLKMKEIYTFLTVISVKGLHVWAVRGQILGSSGYGAKCCQTIS